MIFIEHFIRNQHKTHSIPVHMDHSPCGVLEASLNKIKKIKTISGMFIEDYEEEGSVSDQTKTDEDLN